MEDWFYIILEHYTRFAVCAFLGIASAGLVYLFDIHLFLRIILSIALLLAWILLGLLLEFLRSRRQKKN